MIDELDEAATEINRFNKLLLNENGSFSKLDIQTIFRLLNKIKSKGKLAQISHDNLYTFITADFVSRSPLLAFLDIGLLSAENSQSCISEMQNQETHSYFNFLDFPLDLLIRQHNKIKQISNEKEALQKQLEHQNSKMKAIEAQYKHTIEKFLQRIFNLSETPNERDFSLHSSIINLSNLGKSLSDDDLKTIFDIFSFALKQGDLDATSNVAFCHEHGIGVNSNPNEAIQIYKQALGQGNGANSIFNMGYCYENGYGVVADMYKAIQLFRKASDLGNLNATYRLAVCNLKVDKPNLYQAICLYRKESENGNVSNAFASTAQFLDNNFQSRNLFYKKNQFAESDINESIRLYKKAADHCHINATYDLAVCYELGIGVEPNILEAIHLYRMASEAGDFIATANLAYFYETGLGIEMNLKKAIQLYKQASEKGNLNAKNHLDACNQKLETVENNLKRAFEDHQQKNDLEAMNNLGICYTYGYGTEKDVNKGIELFRRASDDPSAANNLAYLISSNNQKEAFSFYRKASEMGNVEATYNLGYCYEQGIGVGKDIERAKTLYKDASDKGNFSAAYNLGLLNESNSDAFQLYEKASQGNSNAINTLAYWYEHGIGVDVNKDKAVQLYMQASELGNLDAKNNLGYCYEHGIGVEKNYRKAFTFYKEASDGGNLDAMCNLAHCYSHGYGVPINQEEAFRLYKQASDNENLNATCILALCYKKGKCGVPKNIDEAIKYYRKAESKGNSDAAFELGTFYKKGKGVPQDYEKAYELTKKAVDSGNLEAANDLGTCYFLGIGVQKNIDEAIKYYEKAAQGGILSAIDNLSYCYPIQKDDKQEKRLEELKAQMKNETNGHQIDKDVRIEMKIDDILRNTRKQFERNGFTCNTEMAYYNKYSVGRK